jgi:hypothetical protein
MVQKKDVSLLIQGTENAKKQSERTPKSKVKERQKCARYIFTGTNASVD